MELTDLMFNQFTTTESSSGPIVPNFEKRLEKVINDQHFILDPRLMESLTMFYMGMMSWLFRSGVCQRHWAYLGNIHRQAHAITFTTFHSSGPQKWINIFIFHLLPLHSTFLHMGQEVYNRVASSARKWNYPDAQVQHAMTRVRHVMWEKEWGQMGDGRGQPELKFKTLNEPTLVFGPRKMIMLDQEILTTQEMISSEKTSK